MKDGRIEWGVYRNLTSRTLAHLQVPVEFAVVFEGCYVHVAFTVS